MPILRVERHEIVKTHYVREMWNKANIPKRHKDKTLERHTATGPWREAYLQLHAQLGRAPLIVLLGKRGTGKTQLAVDLLADICQMGDTVEYFKMMDLFRAIRSCFRPDGRDESAFLRELYRYGGLVLDEAHERGDSDWEQRTLTNIIDHRYDSMRTTILVSNLNKDAFAEAVGPSVVSRIHETGQVVVCDWPSFREPAQKGFDGATSVDNYQRHERAS